MTVPPPNRPSPLPRVLDDDWEAPQQNRPHRLRVVVVATSIGTALIMACVAILRSSERPWEPGDARAWVRPAPPPYAISPDTALHGTRVRPPPLTGVAPPVPPEMLESSPSLPPPPPRRPEQRRRPQRSVGLAGYLSVNSSPWAELSVDGRVAGSTPQVRVRVTPGRHHLLLVREGFKPHSAWVDVAAGGTVRITNITLEKLAP